MKYYFLGYRNLLKVLQGKYNYVNQIEPQINRTNMAIENKRKEIIIKNRYTATEYYDISHTLSLRRTFAPVEINFLVISRWPSLAAKKRADQPVLYKKKITGCVILHVCP